MKLKKCIIIILFTILLIFTIFIKPKYELNNAVNLIKDSNYEQAYIYICNTENKNNIKIVKELITMKFLNYMTGGLNQMTNIANQGTEIVKKASKSRNNIDYSLDDTLNIYVKTLNEYIEIKNKIPKEMVISELSNSYDLYFEALEFVSTNFVDMLNHIDDENFWNQCSELSTISHSIAADIMSVNYNYDFSEKTQEIYKEME